MIRLPALRLLLGLLAAPALLPAADLTLRTGTFALGGVAEVRVPAEFRFLDAADTRTLLEKLWHNPPDPGFLGAIVPAGFDPQRAGAWAVTISYLADGFVKDNDAKAIDYADLMSRMKAGTSQLNATRQKEGYPPVTIVGWAETPRYDAATHKLYWAKEARFGDAPANTLNYNIRILGRRGTLFLNAIAGMSELAEVRAATPRILQAVNFQPGNRYTDFNSSTDKIAEYGLVALIAGGIAAKAGFFKLLLIGILAAKKFIILALVAIGGFFKKLFRKKPPAETTFGSNPPTP